MKTSILTLFALTISVALAIPVQAGGNNHIGGGFSGFHGGGQVGSNGGGHPVSRGNAARPGFRSGPMRNFGGGRTYYSGQRFSGVGGYSPAAAGFRRPYVANSTGTTQFGSRQFASTNVGRGNHNAQFSNHRTTVNAPRNGMGASQVRNANHLRPNWRSHVVAQHTAGWHRDWDRGRDHWWHGHHCRFINGSWVIFDFGFDPWWQYGYPYDYYADDYSGYPYGYDSDDYDQGVYQGEGDNRNAYGSNDQGADSAVAVAQQKFALLGYYRGEIDGVFGPETRRALMRYQNEHGLRVTGTFDAETLRVLGLPRTASN